MSKIKQVEQSIKYLSCNIDVNKETDRQICKFLEYIARIAYNSNHLMTDLSYKDFIPSLLERQHYGVFEHIIISFQVKTNRAIANELVRHRIASYLQASTRYIDLSQTPLEYIMPKTIMDDNILLFEESILQSAITYNRLIENGIKRQDARDVLPLALATDIIMTLNLSSWMHFLTLRTSKKAHPLMVELANMIKAKLIYLCPTIFNHPNCYNKI